MSVSSCRPLVEGGKGGRSDEQQGVRTAEQGAEGGGRRRGGAGLCAASAVLAGVSVSCVLWLGL